jgi:hypothetical protein
MRKTKLTFNEGAAINRDMFYAVGVPDDLHNSDFEAYSRMVFYQDQMKEKWFYHDLPNWRVVSVCFPDVAPGEVRVAFALSEEGEIELYSRNGSIIERIEDAGLDSSDHNFGYVSRIRHIDGKLYVCGYSGQVYVRNPSGWTHLDEGLLQTSPKTPDEAIAAIANKRSLVDINGYNGSDLYVAGNNGFVAHYDGRSWTRIETNTDEQLNCICCDEKGVVIVGFNGAVLVGDYRAGFRDLSAVEDNSYLYSVTRYQDKLYIGANDGPYVFDHKMTLVPQSKKYKLTEVQHVESKGGVLWVLASKVLLRYDGNEWQAFHHPDNAK